MNDTEAVVEGMTVAELSREAGVPVRTVRFYQTEGLIPAPERVGRRAVYDRRHLERLELVRRLQDRGLQLSAIGEILEVAGEDPDAIEEWLGLGETLSRPWTEDRPELLTTEELDERIGDRPVCVADLEGAGVVERRTDTTPVTYLVPSPALLDIGLELVDLGIPPEVSAVSRELMVERLGCLADELVAHITDNVSLERLEAGGPEAVAELVERSRPLTLRAVGVVFAHEMERALGEIAGAAAEARR